MTNASSDRLDRIEQNLEPSTQLLGALAQNQAHQQEQTQTLLSAVQTLVAASSDHTARIARHDALIERLDAIIERMVYREGRNGDANPPQS